MEPETSPPPHAGFGKRLALWLLFIAAAFGAIFAVNSEMRWSPTVVKIICGLFALVAWGIFNSWVAPDAPKPTEPHKDERKQ
jgi:heme O synthase-like polyprenyltransferase